MISGHAGTPTPRPAPSAKNRSGLAGAAALGWQLCVERWRCSADTTWNGESLWRARSRTPQALEAGLKNLIAEA